VQLSERESVYRDLADLRYDDEALSGYVELVRRFDVAGEHEHELITGADSIIRVDWPCDVWIEQRGRAAEEVEPEYRESAVALRLCNHFRAVERVSASLACARERLTLAAVSNAVRQVCIQSLDAAGKVGPA